MHNQKTFLKIVQTWKISYTPEYRGLRCADCQRYMHKAYHHFLNYGGFKCPVHLCQECEAKFRKDGGKGKSEYRIFTCDRCSINHFKMFHVWDKQGSTLIEAHFCKNCFLRTQGLAL